MSRECRRVPSGWNHPRDAEGRFIPLYDESFSSAAQRWKTEFAEWEKQDRDMEFWEWDWMPPDRDQYRPEWLEESATHYQMYETTSEGTPISPVFSTPEEVARWCADHHASAFAGMTADYESWLVIAKGTSSVSAVWTAETGLISGVEAEKILPGEEEAQDADL